MCFVQSKGKSLAENPFAVTVSVQLVHVVLEVTPDHHAVSKAFEGGSIENLREEVSEVES